MTAATTIDPASFRVVLGHYPTGVVIVTAIDADGPTGLAIGSFTSASLDPPLVGFFTAKSSTSWPRVASVGRFCVNVLGHDQENVCRAFASRGVDKFAGVTWEAAGSGAPIIHDVVAWIDCSIHRVDDAGDHVLVLGEVHDLAVIRDVAPLVFHRGRYPTVLP